MERGIDEGRADTMKTIGNFMKFATAGLFALGWFTGCKSTDAGGSASVSGYYSEGFNDPWYYGDYTDHGDIIVTPPPTRPESPVRVEQPIYHPSPPPMPSIPSGPRPTPRR